MRLFGVARDPAGHRGLSVPSARTHRTHRAGGLVPHPLRGCLGVGRPAGQRCQRQGLPGRRDFRPRSGLGVCSRNKQRPLRCQPPGETRGKWPFAGSPAADRVPRPISVLCWGRRGFSTPTFPRVTGLPCQTQARDASHAAASRGGSFHTAAHPKVLHYLSFSYPEVPPFVVSLCAKGPGDSCTEMGLLILILMLLPPPLLCGLSVGDNASSSFHSASGDPACLSATCPAAGPPACGPHTPQWPQTALPF